MPCCAGENSCSPSRDRSLFSSVLLLGALFGMMSTPCVRAPLVSTFIVVGVPLLTFAVAAPARLGAFASIGLALRDLEALVLGALLVAMGRGRDVGAVVQRQRTRVEESYRHAGLGVLVDVAAPRLHHARRIAMAASLLTVLAGVGLPFVFPSTYTFGDGWTGAAVAAIDVLVFGVVSRLVAERAALRLFEASTALSGGVPWAARLRVTPLSTMLGTALGAVGALVVLTAGSMASGFETTLFGDGDVFVTAAFWFMRTTAPMGLSLGMGIGAVMGFGIGVAQARDVEPVRVRA